MKSVWNGYISFGLVNIPVQLFSATESRSIKFRLLHEKHHSPIRYKRTCEECEGEVEWDEIVKGLEVSKGEYVVFDQEELESIRPEKTDSISIKEFVDHSQLDPIYFNKPYYMAPSKKNEKAFFLFKEVLQNTAKVGIGTFVMREKEYVCAIESYREGLLLTTLNYSYEIRDISKLEALEESPKVQKNELDLAKQLISRMTSKDLNMSKYKDTYAEDLKKLAEKKVKGEEIVVEKEKPQVSREENLIEALKASLEA